MGVIFSSSCFSWFSWFSWFSFFSFWFVFFKVPSFVTVSCGVSCDDGGRAKNFNVNVVSS